MGANRAGVNLRKKQKRSLKNLETYIAAVEKRGRTQPAPVKKKAAKKATKE